METLFRLTLLRPPTELPPEAPPVVLAQDTTLQQQLAEARAGETPRGAMKALAHEFAASDQFAPDLQALPFGNALATLARAFDQLERAEGTDYAALGAAVKAALGDEPHVIVQQERFRDSLRRLRDTMLAIKLLPEEHGRPLERLAQALRDLEVVGRAAAPQAASANPTLNATVRDFQSAHPDFENGLSGLVTGLVGATLPPDKKPIFVGASGAGVITDASTFTQWYTDVPDINRSTTLPLTLTETAPGSGIFEFNAPDFFPIDGALFGNEGRAHNYHFTLELHASFTYQPGQTCHGTADDDMWVYINNQLVVDLGGVHPSASSSVALDTLGLTPGNTYDFDLYFAERRTVSSRFHIQTNIAFLSHPDFPRNGAELRRYRRRPLMLPDFFDLGSALRPPPTEGGNGDDPEATIRELTQRFRAVARAAQELTHVRGEQLVLTPPSDSAAVLPPEAFQPLELFKRGLAQPHLLAIGPVTGVALTPPPPEPIPIREHSERGNGAAAAALQTPALGVAAGVAERPARGVRVTLTGSPDLVAAAQEPGGVRLSEAGYSALPKATRTVLEERQLQVTAHPVDAVVNALHTEARGVLSELEALVGSGTQHSFRRIGDTLVMISTPVAYDWIDIVTGAKGNGFPAPVPVDGRIPQTHGTVAPAGVADLLVVKQQLVGYEAADVAHIENVLRGERKVRAHRRLRQTEELTFRESEITTTEERELESTDRFEMTRETSETIKEDASLKAGLTVSGKYGPTVEFSASAEGAVSRSKEEATKAAATFSKEITQRSATKITERILQRDSLRVTTEVEDRNEHTLDNVGGGDHVIGVYQWVEKVYQAHMFNYGLRTMFDFMVPEPGAFLIETLRRAHAGAVALEKPVPFTLRPDQLDEYNYQYWVTRYGATDIEPPPEPYLTKALDYNAGGGDDKADYNHSAQIAIDDGYRAIHASVGRVVNIWEADWSVDVVVGNRPHKFTKGGSWVWHVPLDHERGIVPFALNTFRVADIAVAVEIRCQRTDRAMAKWRHDTHAKLTQAYRARLAEYEEKLAALEVQAGVPIRGQSPAANLEAMNDELKKACVTILTEQHFDLFDAIQTGSNGLPQIDLFENEAEGPYVRFFEHAFEWEHMTWVTYPYFWGRKHEWPNRLAIDDPDPLFRQFLRAGYCRVVVPVREGFEGAIDHFMNVGEPWFGGPLPPITSPLYLPIAQEIAERLDRPGNEVPQGDPWEVRLPTTLVRLRPDGTLPRWQQNENGHWVPL
jgi:fibro-slime domain-containing protein